MEVPLIEVEPVSELCDADRIFEPGAKIELQVPKLLKPDRADEDVDDPTPKAERTNV